MKIAFVGKGGSGKTTLSALFCRYLAALHLPVLAFDADINQHLGVALGLSQEESAAIPPLGLEIGRVKDYLRGSNPRISSSEQMVKTTPPGQGSRLLRITEENPLYDHFAQPVDNIRLLVTGPFSQDDLGLKCYHSKVGAVELILNHLVDGPNEYAIVDMTAGADSFASGLFTRFDLTCAVVEPTVKSLSVYQQYKTYAHDYGIAICAIGNKIEGEDDIAFLREQVGDDLFTCFGHSSYVRAMEKGRYQPLSQLEEHNTQALSLIRQAVDACQKDWETFYAQAVAFHQKNALSWANAMAGEDLTTQIDPTFSLKAQVMEHILSTR